MAINLVDVSNLLYIGNNVFRNFSVKDVGGNKIKTGGMYQVLNLFRNILYNKDKDIWVFCFDRSSFRKELSESLGVSYKSNRSISERSHIMQSQELEKWLSKIGYNTLSVEGLEADDIISSLVPFAKSTGQKINILSTDRDNAYHVDDVCSLISHNSKVPSVNKSNYRLTVGRNGNIVEYNTILLYKVICGDVSDGIPPVMKESYSLYLRIIKSLQDRDYKLSKLASLDEMEELIKFLPSQIKDKAEINWKLIKPFVLSPDQLKLKSQEIDLESLSHFCQIFGMKSIAKKFGVDLTGQDFNTIQYRKDLVANYRLYEEEMPAYGDSNQKEVGGDSEDSVGDRIKNINNNKTMIDKEFTFQSIQEVVSADIDKID